MIDENFIQNELVRRAQDAVERNNKNPGKIVITEVRKPESGIVYYVIDHYVYLKGSAIYIWIERCQTPADRLRAKKDFIKWSGFEYFEDFLDEMEESTFLDVYGSLIPDRVKKCMDVAGFKFYQQFHFSYVKGNVKS